MSRRTERIAEQLRGEIARALREDVSDPRLSLVTLTRVDVAPDLSHAVVYWSVLDAHGGDEAERVEEVEDALESAASFLRHTLARELPLRRMPALRFRHDPSLDLGSRTLSVLASLADGENDGEKV